MKTAGIIVEYNPMHNGHIHHLKRTREMTRADTVIAVMSGNVVQRGEFAIADKFTRTRWALEAGIDLVVELPAFFTLQNADLFAWAAVAILDSLKVDTVVFGSESGDTHALDMQSQLMRTDAYNTHLKALMNEGASYPSASQSALEKLSGSAFVHAPNDILGVQYINAIRHLKSRMEPLAIKRIESGYHAAYDQGRTIQSATAIRERLRNSDPINDYVPGYVARSLASIHQKTMTEYDPVIRYLLAVHSRESLKKVFSFEEGVESWMLKHRDAQSYDALVDAMATRRYTRSRIKRSIMHMLLNTYKPSAPEFTIPYIRVLGMNTNGQTHLNRIKDILSVPLITKVGRVRPTLLELELKTTRLYTSQSNQALYQEEFDPVIIL